MKNLWKGSSNPSSRRGSASDNFTSLIRSKTGSQSVRGRISGPVPVRNQSAEEIGIREPREGVANSRTHSTLDIVEEKLSADDGKASLASGFASKRVSTSPGTLDPLPARQPSEPQEPQPSSHARAPQILHPSSVSERTDSSSRTGPPKRKKSTFREALHKFLRRGKPEDGHRHDRTFKNQEPQRDSSNSALKDVIWNDEELSRGRRSQGADKEKAEPQRSGSAPISEYDRALRSHSIGPEDVMVINTVRNSLNAENLFYKTRTGSGRTRDISPIPLRDGELAGLSPRPVSTHGRSPSEPLNARLFAFGEHVGIGRAISSDKRRSRSVSGLYSHQGWGADDRRRSDEIKFWRDSYAIPIAPPIPSSPGDLTTKASRNLPPHSFHFGGAVRSMKITEAADVDARVGRLEQRMSRVERSVWKAGELAVPRYAPGYTEEKEDFSRPGTSDSELVGLSLVGGPAASMAAPKSGLRPSSLATVRGVTDLPLAERNEFVPLRLEHYLNLMQMIETERSSRQALEAQVKSLAHQVRMLSKSSTEANKRLSQLSQRSSRMEVSAFDHDDTEDEEEGNGNEDDDESKLQPSQPSRRPHLQAGARDDDLDNDKDRGSSQASEPSHERNHSLSAFGQDLRNDYDRKAARTLSFSQYNRENDQ